MKRIVIAALLFATGAFVATPSFALTRGDLFGEARTPGSAFGTIRITPASRYVNVYRYRTVNLDINGKVVTWRFDGLARVFPLTEIVPDAPPNILVYVTQINFN